jgi:hypothetical protein
MGYPSSNMAENPYLRGFLNGKVVKTKWGFSIAMFDLSGRYIIKW